MSWFNPKWFLVPVTIELTEVICPQIEVEIDQPEVTVEVDEIEVSVEID